MSPVASQPGTMSPAQLRAIQEQLGLSTAEFARRLGCSRSAIYNYLAGRDRATGRPIPAIPLTVELAALALQAGLAPARKPRIQGDPWT